MTRRIMRRALVAGASGLVLTGGAALWTLRAAPAGGATTMTPPEALAAARAGEILLVDVRRPAEWAATGVPEGAVPLDMRRRDFAAALAAARAGRDVPVAVICARGVRSRRLAAALREAGIGEMIDVPEGMLGSGTGPGWAARGLPVLRP